MERPEFAKLWVLLIGAYPNAPALQEIHEEAYFAALAKFPTDQVVKGVKAFIERSGARFFPSAPELIAWVDPPMSREDQAFDQAAEKLKRRDDVATKFTDEFLATKGTNIFVRVSAHPTDRFKDRWAFVPQAQAVKAARGGDASKFWSAAHLRHYLFKGRRLPLPDHAVHHLHNMVRSWVKTLPEGMVHKLLEPGR